MAAFLTIGIDEVGRGALAGPVVCAAVASRGRVRFRHPELGPVRDSKRLTPMQRERWARWLAAHPRLECRVAWVGPRVIDRINISRAADRAAMRLVRTLCTGRCSGAFAWLDGGIRLPGRIPHRSLVRGDMRKPLIAAASIVAKVWRDRAMVRLARRHPGFGFDRHKGYATAAHRSALAARGVTPMHRRTFLRSLDDRV